ncbi:hypothetical protein PybrP1_008976 [[Pythium] brassicae (nom. inval.)]|nr:hypothetical protein PybrP1_008976 [[Pythium] brassicae (nom. inval.)]
MDRFDLSRQAIASLAQVSDDIVQQVEHSAGGDSEYGYALSLAQNRIVEVFAIGRFQRVAQLDLSNNKIVSLDGVQALVRLESLIVAGNNLTSVDILASLPSLRELSVAKNSIVQLDGLKGCRELMVLDASFNNVTKWPRLHDLAALESLDLSSNLLEAFAPSTAPALFPSDLRRLSIAKNQIHEYFNVEGNVGVVQTATRGGKLEYLFVNLFPSMPLSGASVKSCVDPFVLRSTRELFEVPQSTVAAVERAVQQQDEDALAEFLRTGTTVLQSEAAEPVARSAVLATTTQASRFKVWIKREQVAREAAARRLQKWHRSQRLRRAIAARVSVKTRQWCDLDVAQLQQVCVVQERAMVHLWDSAARAQRYLDIRIEKAVVRVQSLWRGHAARKHQGTSSVRCRPVLQPTPVALESMSRTIEQQAQEIARLTQQVHALESAVERLLLAQPAKLS